MTDIKAVFGDAWRECLRSHYEYVVRQNDKRTLETLTYVLHHEAINYSDDELREWFIQATIRAEDFTEAEIRQILEEQPELLTPPAAQPQFQPHPLECQCPACIQINLRPHDDEGQPLPDDKVAEIEAQAREEARRNDPDAPRQLSLF